MFSLKRSTLAAATVLSLGTPFVADAQGQDLRSPDARDAATAQAPDLRSPDARDAAVAPMRRVRIVEVPSTGLDWTDAGIGAAGTLALVLMVSGASAAAVRRRSPAAR